jgi:hypothetical protein
MVIAKTVEDFGLQNFQDKANLITWANMPYDAGDIAVGEELTMTGSPDRSVQVVGTFGTGGTCVIEGSNNGVNWTVLKDHLANTLSFTAAGIQSIDQITRFIRPRVSGGDGTTSLTVIMHVRRLSSL